jgi:hypothetical protein
MSTVSFGPPERERRTAAEKAIRFAVAVAVLVVVAYLVFGTGLVAATPRNLCLAVGALAIYLLVAYFVDLEPDCGNPGYSLVRDHSGRFPILGWLRIDDPFQWSDDVAREFLLYRILLTPGRFVAIALTDPLFPNRRRKRPPPVTRQFIGGAQWNGSTDRTRTKEWSRKGASHVPQPSFPDLDPPLLV